ncbi:MAG: hypothetical protein AAGK00_07570 [Pseudomonadota bacterium]
MALILALLLSKPAPPSGWMTLLLPPFGAILAFVASRIVAGQGPGQRRSGGFSTTLATLTLVVVVNALLVDFLTSQVLSGVF